MARVSFGRVILSEISGDDPAEMGFKCQGITRAPTVNVASVTTAAGSTKMRVTPGRVRNSKVTINFADDAGRKFIEAHQGVPLCYRAARGEKFFGYYGNDLSLTVALTRNVNAVTLTVTEITYDEAR